MPIWRPSLIAAGFDPDTVLSPFHTIARQDDALNANFLLHAGPLGDILPIPIPFIRNVASIGDLFLSAGLGFFLFATVLRSPAQAIEEDAEAACSRRWQMAGPARPRRPRAGRPTSAGGCEPSTGLASGLAEASVLASTSPPRQPRRRPVARRIDRHGAGAGGPTSARPSGAIRVPRPGAEVSGGSVRHPYVRLALNSSFSALWAGQLISLFGDRIHQIALAFLVLAVTNSPVAVAFVFVFASLPNLFLSPIAGTYVDRWDQKDVMVVSDLLRAAIILIIPIAAVTNILLVYPLIFADHVDLDLLPAGAGGGPAADRSRGRAADGELGDVGRRDDRRRHRLPAGRGLRRLPRAGAAARVLDRCRDVRRVSRADRHDLRPSASRSVGCGSGSARASSPT